MDQSFAARLLAMLFALSIGLACAQSAPPNPKATPAAQFDEVLERLVGPYSMDLAPTLYNDNLDRLRTLIPGGDHAREIQFRSVYCISQHWRDPKQGLAYSDDAIKRAHAVGDIASEARAMFCRTAYTLRLHGTKQGLAEVNKIIAFLQDTPEQQLLSELYLYRGTLLSELGEQAKALLDYQRARAGYRAIGITKDLDELLLQSAITYRRIGDWAQAERYFKSAVQRMQDKQDWTRTVTNLIQLGFLYDESGNPQKSLAAFEQAVAVATEHKDPTDIGGAKLGLASAQISQGQFDNALQSLTEVKTAYAEAGIDPRQDMLLLLTGQAHAGKGQHTEALAYYQKALPLIERDGNERYLALLYQAQAASEEALGRSKEALNDYRRYSTLQLGLQQKMRLEQSRLLEYEYEIRRREFENQRLRTEAAGQQKQVQSLERERRWQILALTLGVLLLVALLVLVLRQIRSAKQLRILAMTDPLTSTLSRRAVEAALDRHLVRTQQHAQPISVMMLDLDYFKAINDRHGHPIGDEVLRTVTACWKEQLRDNDALGRIGGEEFIIICPNTDAAQAQLIADRLLQTTRMMRLPEIAHDLLPITTSIGIAQGQPNETREELIARADAALYQAKQQGRNQVVL